MQALEFLKMMKEDATADKDGKAKAIVAVMEAVIASNPGCEIDPSKTALDCYKKMFESAKQEQKRGSYCFDTEATIAFVAEYLGIPKVSANISVAKKPTAVNLSDFF